MADILWPCRTCGGEFLKEVRSATPEDMQAIRECHAEIEAFAGEKLDLPEVGDRAMLDYRVAMKDGKVIGAMYLEKSIRMCFVGTDPEATAAFRAEQKDILAASKEAGIRFIHCQVVANLPATEDISRHLERAGFIPRPDLLDHMCDLRDSEAPCK